MVLQMRWAQNKTRTLQRVRQHFGFSIKEETSNKTAYEIKKFALEQTTCHIFCLKSNFRSIKIVVSLCNAY